MSVPTNNLYNFVAQALENRYIIKYFYPWGEKRLRNIVDHKDDYINCETYNNIMYKINMYHITRIKDHVKIPNLLCHDQEPLDFDRHSDDNLIEELDHIHPRSLVEFIHKAQASGFKNLNLRWIGPTYNSAQWVLLHSELNSPEVVKYQYTGLFKCAYWWSHAVLARDWYRYAQYDNRLTRQSQDIKANFLIYARATSGTRAYRKEFLEHVKDIDSLQIGSFMQYQATSDSSAIYDYYDFAHSNCSVVLETIFDQRVHLTEKTLRPIACGHPFLILNGPGALENIRSYGFKTFEPFINESYDREQSPAKRMHMVIKEMQRINNLSTVEQTNIWKECNLIAEYNKQLFFNDSFLSSVKAELQKNVLV